MTQIIGPNGKPFYLPPSSQAQESWQLARRSAQLQNNLSHAQQSIARSNAPFRPPGSTGQTVAANGVVTTHYGPSGSKTTSPTGRTTYQPGTASNWRTPTNTVAGTNNPLQIRRPSSYAPAPVRTAPTIAPIRARGVPKPQLAIPKGAGGRAIAGGAGGIASGVLAAGATAIGGGTLGQSVGAGVGATVGTIGGAALGTALGAVAGPVGAAVGGYMGGAIGGTVGAGVGGWLGGVINPPSTSLPSSALAPTGAPVYGLPPFSGGQSATEYKIRVERDRFLTPSCTYNGRAGSEEIVMGPISAITPTGTGGSICGFAAWANYEITHGGPNGNSTTTYLSNTASSTSFNSSNVEITVTRTDGQPDIDGDPPAEVIAQAQPRSPIFAVPVINAPNLPAPVYQPNPQPSPPAPAPVPPGPAPAPLAPPQPISPPATVPARPPGVKPQTRNSGPGNVHVPMANTPLAQQEATQDPLVQEVVQVQMATAQDLGGAIAGSQSLGDANLIGTDQDPNRASGFAPVPIPLGMPVGAPRAGDVPKPKGTVKGVPKVRPRGPTATQTQGAEPPRQPPPPKTGNPCGCNVQIMKKLDTLGGVSAGTEAASLAAIMDKLNKMQKFAEKAWETTRIQKVLDVLTFVAVMHNVALLSRDVGETFGWVASQTLQIVGIKDEEDNPIDVYGWFTGSIENLLVSVLGEEVVTGVQETWNKASAILRSASMIIWTIRSIADSSLDLMEWIGENTGRIGNALKAYGVVGKRAFPWMSERAQVQNRLRRRFSRVTGALENAEDVGSNLGIATGTVIELQDEVGELGGNAANFRDSVINGIPDPWADNIPVRDAQAVAAAASVSPDVSSADIARGN